MRSRRRELLKTARAGDVRAQFELACAYNFETPKKRRLAVYWYHKAAEQGHPTAQNYLGESHRCQATVILTP
jgi:TPR repeat protein